MRTSKLVAVAILGLAVAACSSDNSGSSSDTSLDTIADTGGGDATLDTAGPDAADTVSDAVDDVGDDAGPDVLADVTEDIADAVDAGDAADAEADAEDATLAPNPVACTDKAADYTGPLCGPGELACAVLFDATVDLPHFRNDGPTVAVDGVCRTSVTFAESEDEGSATWARHELPGTWLIQGVPGTPIIAGHALGPDAEPFVATYDGAFGVAAFAREESAFEPLDALEQDFLLGAAAIAHDGESMYLALAGKDDEDTVLATWNDGWTLGKLGATAGTPSMVTRVVTVDEPHVYLWRTGAQGWEIAAVGPDDDGDTVAPIGSNALVRHHFDAALYAQEGGTDAHVIYNRQAGIGVGSAFELALTQRELGGKWGVEVLGSELDDYVGNCDFEPSEDGEECDYDYKRLIPVAVVVGPDGDPRTLHSQQHRKGTLVAKCDTGGGVPQCTWDEVADESTGELHVGWIDGESGFQSTAVLSDIRPITGRATVDRKGQIHVAVYDLGDQPEVEPGAESSVRVVVIGFDAE